MKQAIQCVLATVLILCAARTAAQVGDQTPQPTSPQDRIAPTGEMNGKSQAAPVTLKVLGATLRDSQGSAFGRIEHLIVDPNSGRVEFLIVSPYLPTNGTKVLPVPWKAITYQADDSGMGTIHGANQIFAVNVPRSKLPEAPTFERSHWPNLSQAGWRQPIYDFYGARSDSAKGGVGGDREVERGSASGRATKSFIGPVLESRSPSTINGTNAPAPVGDVLPANPGSPLPAEKR